MYQVLARKYRPRNFKELVGQNHVSRALTSALDRGRLHHAYLFTGTRGVGKTTIARILAKCLNCETGITSTPCEVCATCTAVNEGRFIDLIEIDAASRTKVEDTRELLDNVPYAPTQGRFKVYLIDEVHMLSTHSFNALLKTLEEPPEHVKFLFATTDPQKLPITVISRCLQFTLRPLAVDEITHHLADILQKEEIQSEQDAIWQIAESAQGSVRDALSLTDQAIAYGQGAIHHQDVKEMLGLIDRTIIYDLILAIHQNKRERVSQLLLQFRQQALDVSLVLDQFISTLHELAMLQYLPDLSLKYSAEINQKIMRLSQLISAQDLQLYYQIACKGRSDLQLAVTQEQGFEMTILRLLAFRPLQSNEITVSEARPVSSSSQDIEQQESLEQSGDRGVIDRRFHENKSSVDSDVQTDFVNQQETIDESRSDVFNQQSKIQEADHFESNPNQYVESQPAQMVEDQLNTHDKSESISSHDFTQTEENVAPIQSAVAEQTLLDSRQSDLVEEEPTLTLFEDGTTIHNVVSQVINISLLSDQEIFFLDPNKDLIEGDSSKASVQNMNVEKIQETNEQKALSDLKPHITSSKTLQTPQDILTLAPLDLMGEWDVNKWEYWFRNSELSPAVQELAQHGMMTGQIDDESTFHIPQRYEALLNQTQHDLEAQLIQKWPNTRFIVQYEEVAEKTPFILQNARKVKAHQRASEMLSEEVVVKSLIDAFDGEVQNIQLKS